MAETTRPGNPDRQAITLLQSSGILNPNVTLAENHGSDRHVGDELRPRWSVPSQHFHSLPICLQNPRVGEYDG